MCKSHWSFFHRLWLIKILRPSFPVLWKSHKTVYFFSFFAIRSWIYWAADCQCQNGVSFSIALLTFCFYFYCQTFLAMQILQEQAWFWYDCLANTDLFELVHCQCSLLEDLNLSYFEVSVRRNSIYCFIFRYLSTYSRRFNIVTYNWELN